jgi:hypothetical protein
MLELMMRSRINAVLLTFVFACGMFLIPPMALLASATIALVVLRNGWLEGALVVISAFVALYAVAYFIASPQMAMGLIKLWYIWLPVLVLAELVKRSGNLRTGLLWSAVVAVFYWLTLFNVTDGNPREYWFRFIKDELLPVMETLVADPAALKTLIPKVAANMNGMVISGAAMVVWLSLIIARYWQAKLYNPGGFGEEFRCLMFGVIPAGLGLVMVVVALLLPESEAFGFAVDLKQFAVSLFLLQGLALLHYFVKGKSWPKALLFLVYGFLLFIPAIGFLLALAGAMDNFIDFRKRLAA